MRLTDDLAPPARRLEDVPDVPRRERPAEMITLHLIAIVVAQESDLFIRLDALRDDFQFNFWPSEITALATALSFSFMPRSLMNDLSIFSRATGNVFSELRLE